MIYSKHYIINLLCFISFLWGSQIQLVTAHNKSNGLLLRIVTSKVVDIDNIAGWKGQENWFYLTLNGASLSPTIYDKLEYETPLIDIEINESNESVQLGFLFDLSIEDFEIFHSPASRILLIQIWESLNDSLRMTVKNSEGNNLNRVFSLPKEESKGSPFYDSFIYARDKYGPEKYFVWYSNWYSTKDSLIDNVYENASNNTLNSEIKVELEPKKIELNDKEDPKPMIVLNKQKKEISGPPLPPLPQKEPITKESIDISFIIDDGLLQLGINRPKSVYALQKALFHLGYDLGDGGMYRDGIDGTFGTKTESAVIEFQLDRGFNAANVDGIVGEGTHKELIRALSGEKPLFAMDKEISSKKEQSLLKIPKEKRQTAKELLNQTPIKTQVKRETRKLSNVNQVNLLPIDLSKRKTFLKLTCNLEGADVFIDGSLIGKTPIPKKLSVTPGWHRVRVVDPDAAPQKFAMSVPDYQDIYIPQGRTQKIRINLAVSNKDSEE